MSKAIIQFIKNFDLDNPNWQNMPKDLFKEKADISGKLISKYLSMKTMFELQFNRDLKAEKNQKSRGGYKNLEAFKMAEIVYDFTVAFCDKYMSYKTNRSYRTYDQMVQAARSGKQNIAEGSQRAAVNPTTEIQLVDVARASLQELLEDYNDFLRNNKLKKWSKDDPRVKAIRALAYKPNKSYKMYRSYMANPEEAVNCAITLINQTNYLLDRLLWSLKRRMGL